MRALISTLLGLCLALVLTGGRALADTEAFTAPGDFTATYELKRAGLTVGQADLRYRRVTEDRYSYRLYTRATGLARLIYSSRVRERSAGLITEDGSGRISIAMSGKVAMMTARQNCALTGTRWRW